VQTIKGYIWTTQMRRIVAGNMYQLIHGFEASHEGSHLLLRMVTGTSNAKPSEQVKHTSSRQAGNRPVVVSPS